MATASQSQQGIKKHFKTAEGRYKLFQEKTHPTGMMYYTHHRGPTKVTLAHLKDRPLPPAPAPPAPSTASRFVPKLSFSSGTGKSSSMFGVSSSFSSRLGLGSRSSSISGSSTPPSNGPAAATTDAEGTYLLFNVGESLFIADYSSGEKDPVKSLHFPGVRSLCHAFRSEATDGHDLIIGTDGGDVYTASLGQQMQDSGRKLIGANHLNKDGVVCNSRVTALAWVPQHASHFVAAHADGNLLLYDVGRDGSAEAQFPPPKDSTTFCVTRGRNGKSNPVARWRISSGAINDVAFSSDAQFLAAAGRDGYLRVFDWSREVLLSGCKSYYGAILCCAFSPDAKYVVFGGEDDLVHIWSTEDLRVVAWCEGHGSWVSSVSFDPFWDPPTHDADGPSAYRFGSVAQDAQLLLWDLSLDEVVLPLRRLPSAPSSSPSSTPPRGLLPASTSLVAADAISPMRLEASGAPGRASGGALHPHPPRKEVPKVAPIMAHKVHSEPLADIIFCKDSVITACNEGLVKVWARPSSEPLASAPAANGGAGGARTADARVDSPLRQIVGVR